MVGHMTKATSERLGFFVQHLMIDSLLVKRILPYASARVMRDILQHLTCPWGMS